MKKIGIIIPVYNGENTIDRSIKSLVFQTFKDWIAIIINDGSTDNTDNILNKYKDDDRFYILHFQNNKGRPYARHKGLEIVKKLNLKYMCMLDADDWYYPEKLDFQFQFMDNHPNIVLLSSAIGVTNKQQELFKVIKPFAKRNFFKFNNYKNYVMLPHASSIIRVSKISNDLSYDCSLYFSEDQDFLRRLLINENYAFDPIIQYIYNREDSFSLNKYYSSMYYGYKSFKNLNLGIKANIIRNIKNKVKYFIVWILTMLNLQKVYMSKVGIDPTALEFFEYKENQKHIM